MATAIASTSVSVRRLARLPQNKVFVPAVRFSQPAASGCKLKPERAGSTWQLSAAPAQETSTATEDPFLLDMVKTMLQDPDLRQQLDQALSPEARSKLSKVSSADAIDGASQKPVTDANFRSELEKHLQGTGCSNLTELFGLMGFSPSEAADLVLSAKEESGNTK